MDKFYIKTYGCASNFADSQIVRQMLLDSGYEESDLKSSDFVLINTCTVKGPTVNKIKDFILITTETKKKKQNIIILGCLPSDRKFIKDFAEYSMVSPYNIDSIPFVCDTIKQKKKPVHLLEPKFLDKTKYGYDSKKIAIVQPLIGCLGNCTFCKTKLAKPVFYSYPLENILNRIESHIQNGAKEIWISSEDNAAYGKYIGLSYIDLLKNIEKKFGGKAMFRFGMSNPWLILNHLDELIDFIKHTKAFFRFLHIPIQSASNNVLKKMTRPYTESDLKLLFSKLRDNFGYKELTIATDTIVGFPNERDKDFEKTKEFVQKYDILVNNVSQFWPIPYTKAHKMKQLSTQVKKTRSIILSSVVKDVSTSLLDGYIDDNIEVYFDGVDVDGNYLGRTRNYVSTILKKPSIKPELGQWLKYRIKAVENHHLLI